MRDAEETGIEKTNSPSPGGLLSLRALEERSIAVQTSTHVDRDAPTRQTSI